MTDLGVLKSLELRQIWRGEDRDFTLWLGENLDRLGAALGMTLEATPHDNPAGVPPADLIVRDRLRDRPVAIEGQLDGSDDERLGRLVTCAAGAEACAVVWVAPVLRDPHRAALDWLNAHSDDVEFFGVALEAVQIDDSRPALNFRVTAFPNTWQKTLSERPAGGSDDRDVYFYRFNEALLAALREAGTFAQLPAARPRSEVMLHTTHGGVRYGSSFSRNILRIGLWITFPDAESNRATFEKLRAQKREIESALGGADLEWDFNPDRRGQVITMNHIGVNRDEESQIPSLAKWAAEGLAKMKGVFEPRLDRVLGQTARNGGVAV